MTRVNEKSLKGKTYVVELKTYLSLFWKWKGLIIKGTILSLIIVALINLGISLVTPKVYRATALLGIGTVSLITKDYEELGKSPAMATRVIEKLGLDKPPYRLTPENLIQMISIGPVKDYTVPITVEYTDPEKAREIANAVTISIAELGNDQNEAKAIKIRDSLKIQLDEINLTFTKMEQESLDLKVTVEMARLKKEILMEEQKKIEQELLEIDRIIEEKMVILDVLTRQLGNEKKILVFSKSLANDPIVQDILKETLNPSVSTLLKIQVKDEQLNPLYKELESKLIVTFSDLEALKTKKAALTKDLDINEKKLKDLQKELVQKESSLASVIRNYDLIEKDYKSLKEKFEKAQSDVASIRSLGIRSPADTPQSPVNTSKKINLLFTGIIGFFVLTALAFGLEYISYYKTRTASESHLS
jgi:capsular polysaccharide biosynthesis protein